jgi:nitrite reductase/ring-hydroxylating ferredoxin subunit
LEKKLGDKAFAAAMNEADLPEGKMHSARVKGTALLLAKVNGQVYAVSNNCPHQGCQLNNGTLNGYMVMCPCHGWKFDLRNGTYQEIPQIKLDCYPVKVENRKILVEVPKRTFF